MVKGDSCPVALETVPEKIPRIVAGLVAIVAILFLVTGVRLLIIILIFDFLCRALRYNQYSPFAIIARSVVKQFRLNGKQVDIGPKIFAAKLGLLFSLAIFIISWLSSSSCANILTYVLLLFALLESLLNYCVGCKVYQLLLRLRSIYLK